MYVVDMYTHMLQYMLCLLKYGLNSNHYNSDVLYIIIYR